MLIVGAALCVCAPLVFADAPRTGLVTGVVLDPDGAPMPGATVQLISDRGTETAISDEEGKFRFVFVMPGAYSARADLEGFQSPVGEIIVSAGGRAEVELQLGEVLGEEIVVVAETPLINKFDVTAGATVTQEEMAAVVAEGRNATQVMNYMPSVVNDSNSQRWYNFQPDVEGVSAGRQAYYLDGVDMSFARAGGGSRLQFPAYALQEVKLESSGIDAQYSRTVGAVTTMTLAFGTNDFHGGVTYYAQNLAWNENYTLTPTPEPDELKHSWELILSGPLVRDKLWFMVAYGDRVDPGKELLYGGTDAIDSGNTYEAPVAKLDWRPSATHSITAAYVKTPILVSWFNPTTADLYAAAFQDIGTDFTHVGWNWAISDSLLLDTHVALQGSYQERFPQVESPIDPSCSPAQPCGNDYVYMDATAGGNPQYNGMSLPLGIGSVDWPRDQFNVSVDWFTGVHDVKAGVDYQDMAWESTGTAQPLHIGGMYDPSPAVPGGFRGNMSPNPAHWGRKRVFFGPGEGEVSKSEAEVLGVYIRDRIALDRWTFNLGLRFDQGEGRTDAGVLTNDSSDVAPRLAAVFDPRGDSTLLLSATAGRYYYLVNMEWSAQFNETPSGRAFFSEYDWNPATQDYDLLRRVLPPPAPGDISQVDPYSKDEFTLGLDWSFHPDWVFKTKLLYWTMNDFHTNYLQVTADGTSTHRVQINDPDFEADRQAIHLVLQRRFKNGWSVAASYVYSETEVNCQIVGVGDDCARQTGELEALVDPETGIPWSRLNRDGEPVQDHPHVFKVRGSYLFNLGAGHTLNLGGFFWMSSGTPHELRTNTPFNLPGGGRENIWVFAEPRGSSRTPTQKQLNMTVGWDFPLFGQLNGNLRIEASNVTNEEVLIGIIGLDRGTPMPTSLNYQRPRNYRLMAGLQF
jgi:hypothetical protein